MWTRWLMVAALCGSVACDGASGVGDALDSGPGADSALMEVADSAADAGPDAAAPLPDITVDGPFSVGFRTLEVSYTPATFDAVRTLQVAVWYPTEATSGPTATYEELVERDAVFTDAPPAGDAPFPVLVFSHGNGGIAEQNWTLCERLATHGWLVVAPAHKGNTFFDFDKKLDPVMFLLRPMDVSATLDAMEALAPGDPLSGRVGEHIALAGHSFGGYTTLVVGGAALDVDFVDATCALDTSGACELWTEPRRQLALAGFRDDRFEALVPMAPSTHGGLLGEGATGSITAPTLMMTGDLDLTTPDATNGDILWGGMVGSQHLRLGFPTAGHYTFSNACELGLGVGADDGCGEAFIARDRALAILDAFTLGWLRYHLMGDASVLPLLDGEDPLADGLVLSRPTTSSQIR